ncbi:MAG: hypothetical protein FJ010_05280 [Chloroflexi bacterium]|nr:hypothetical protein [Chloroflexota bacterium]
MRPTIRIILLIGLFLGSCNLPKSSDLATPRVDSPTPTRESAPQGLPAPASAPTILPSATQAAPPIPSTLPTAAIPSGPTIQGVTSSERITITTIHMLDEQAGWGVGNQGGSDHILFTTDGGLTWDERTPPEPASTDPAQTKTARVYFADDHLAWTIYTPTGGPPPIGDQYVWYTRDGGQNWQASSSLPLIGLEAFFIPEGFAFVDPQHGWLLAHVDAGMSHDYSYLFATTDGGASWQRITDPYSDGLQSLHNTGLAFLNAEFGWVTKDNLGVMAGAFFEQTADGGVTWEDVFLPAPAELDWFSEASQCLTSGLVFTGAQRASLIVKCRLSGEDTSDDEEWSFTYIYTTQDLGNTWQHTLLSSPVENMFFLDDMEGWAFGREYYRTTDGGFSWVPVKSVNWDGQFSFIDPINGWAVARNADEIALVNTIDGGATWQIIEPTTR